MNPRSLERRDHRVQKFLRSTLRFRFGFVIRLAIKAVAHAHVELSRPGNLEGKMMKLASQMVVKGRFVGTVTNQVVTELIVQDLLNAASQIIRISNRESPG